MPALIIGLLFEWIGEFRIEYDKILRGFGLLLIFLFIFYILHGPVFPFGGLDGIILGEEVLPDHLLILYLSNRTKVIRPLLYIIIYKGRLAMFDESTKLCDVKYKIVFLGQSGVGKSAIIERFIQERFDPSKAETVGIDFLVKNIHYQGAIYRLQLWDTAGQEKFKSLVPNYIRDAHCAVFVYDVAMKESFDGVDSWLELYNDYHCEDAVTILVGNKTDMKQRRKVSRQEGQFKARSKGLSFCETSAKTGSGIEQLFHSIIQNIRINKEQPGQQCEPEKEGNKSNSTSQGKINKTKIVKIGKEKKQFPCCYI